ncbi:MAG: HAD family hydrolase [Bacillota bacterium]
MLRALLLDLDGTLLGNDMDQFLKYYFGALAKGFNGLVPGQELVAQIMASTERMMRDTDPSRTNQEVFWADFLPRFQLPAGDLIPRFDRFYASDFRKLEGYTRRKPEARAVVQKAVDRGLKVVVATNPMFPIFAIVERMRWAGVADFPFDLITSYEVMHACKPHLQYYQEICDVIGVKPEEAMMAGNDVQDDMVAGKLGMKTFLVDEELLHREPGEPRVDYRGTLAKLAEML